MILANNGPRLTPRAALVLVMSLILAMMTGCAKPRTAPLMQKDALALWQTFAAQQRALPALSAIETTASISYRGKDQSGRASLKLWGQVDTLLRMDISAGFGTTVASIRETHTSILSYIPEMRTAYIGQRGQVGTGSGMTLPFSLSELTLLMAGHYLAIMPKTFIDTHLRPDGTREFTFASDRVTSITLDGAALPVEISGLHQNKHWTLRLERYTDGTDAARRARRLNLRTTPNERVVLRVKRVESLSREWPREALELPLPPGTVTRPMDSLAPLEL